MNKTTMTKENATEVNQICDAFMHKIIRIVENKIGEDVTTMLVVSVALQTTSMLLERMARDMNIETIRELDKYTKE